MRNEMFVENMESKQRALTLAVNIEQKVVCFIFIFTLTGNAA